MKKIYIITVLLATMALSWIMPELYKMVNDEAPEYPMAFYSSVADKFCLFELSDEGLLRKDIDGNEYTQQQFDSLLPMLYANQLASDQRLPKEIKGREVSMDIIRYYNFSHRYNPKAYNKPSIKLYPLFESMSDRVEIATPSDMFRLTDSIEFIDIEKNMLDIEKSNMYNSILFNTGFNAPAKRICGIPSSRKNYDEGYFIIDSNNALFHLKRINGKAFIRNVDIDKSIKVEYFEAIDNPNRQSYGFLFDTVGQMYVLSTDSYKLIKIGIPPIDMNKDVVSIMANMFYWNINVQSDNLKTTYAVDANTKMFVDSYTSENTKLEESIIENILPFALNLTSKNDGYVKFRVVSSFPLAFAFNILFVISYFCIFRKVKLNKNILPLLYIAITGIYGFIACTLFKSDINK